MRKTISGALRSLALLTLAAGCTDLTGPPTVADDPSFDMLEGAGGSALVGLWRADGDALDAAGANHGTTVNGTGFAPGVAGQAFQFDGVNDWVSVPDNDNLSFGTGDFSVSFWLLFNDLQDAGNGVMQKDNWVWWPTMNGWMFNICDHCGDAAGFGNGTAGFGFQTRDLVDGVGPMTHARIATSELTTGRWYHMAGTREDNVLRLYVDGVLAAEVEEAAPTDVTTRTELRFGALHALSLQAFGGLLDEVRIYDRALSQTEVEALFEAGGSDPNRPPEAEAGADVVAECTLGAGSVVLSGIGSSDPDGDGLTYVWSLDGEVIATGATATVMVPLGAHAVTLTVEDPAGATDSDEMLITVSDTTSPVINLSLEVEAIWPPNGQMVRVASGVSATDACHAREQLGVDVTVADTGGGTAGADWTIVENDDGTVDIDVRAERSGDGVDRAYSIAVAAIDPSGNESHANATVVVPHDQGGGKAKGRNR